MPPGEERAKDLGKAEESPDYLGNDALADVYPLLYRAALRPSSYSQSGGRAIPLLLGHRTTRNVVDDGIYHRRRS